MILGAPKVVIWPNVAALLRLDTGLFQLAWFRMLKKSERNSILNRSRIWNCRLTAMSKFLWPGPYRELRPRLPNWPLKTVQAELEPAHWKAAGFRYCRTVFGAPYTWSGKITLGRSRFWPLREMSLPSVIWMGLPVNMLMIGETCQSLVINRAEPPPNPGLRATKEVVKECRWSYPQLPRSPVARLSGFW